jgi:hypothetical protein
MAYTQSPADKYLYVAVFWQGPYVPSGVTYGPCGSPSYCEWLIPGYDLNPPIHKMDLYDNDIR